MIVYFADRHMNILGVASDLLPGAFHLRDDMKTSELENGVSTFEVTFDYKKDTHVTLKKYCAAGNFLLVKEKDGTYTPYTIIDKEDDISDRHIYVYAEDAGLDLLNEIVPAFELAPSIVDAGGETAANYILAFTADSGFEIGINEIAKNDDGTDKKRSLSWDSESTATERIRSVATEFDNAEIGYSFTIDKFRITHKYINLYKKHGKDVALELRFGREVDNIVEKESVANLVTALRCYGGTPEATDAYPDPLPVTFSTNGYVQTQYTYDDGNFYVDSVFLKSREANKKWSRYLTDQGTGEGFIVGSFDYDTTSQSELCNRALTELKKLCEPEITYEVSLNTIPENLKLGDTCRLVDDNGELYVSARLIELKISECNRTREATFGDFKKLTSGINDKVEKLADEFAKIQASKTLYTWIVFADDSQGTNISTSSEGKSYIGIATNKISPDPVLDANLYRFTRISAVDGRGFTVRGSWAPNTSYSITGTNIDVVEHEGSTYACNNSHVSGQTFDPSKWVLIAEKGTDGQDGQDGTNGSDGLSMRGVLVRNNWNDASWQSHGIIGYNPTSGYTNYDIPGQTTPTYTTPKLDTSLWQAGDFFQITGTSTDTGIGYVVTCRFISASSNKQKIYAETESISYSERGDDGEDGYSPTATVTKSGDTTTITITDKNGTTTQTILDGEDGHSPTITTTKSGTTTTILADGVSIGTVIDGDDGHSPAVTATKTDGVTTVKVDGTTIATINDGSSVIIQSATKVGDTTTVILKDGSGTQTLTIKDGEDGDNGQPGSNGDDAYVHIAWAASADGSEGFSTSVSEGKTYMGSYSDHTLADSQTPSDYNWSLIKGEDGYSPTATVTKSGSTATITITDKNGTTTETVSDGTSPTAYSLIVSHAAIVKAAGDTVSYTPTSITLSAKSQTGSGTFGDYFGNFKIETTTNGTSWTQRYPSSGSGTSASSYSYEIPTNISGLKAIRCSLYLSGGLTTLLDQQIVPIVSDGTNGTNGTNGTDGEDAYTVILTNENHTFAGGTTAAIVGSTECEIVAYKGATQIAAHIGTITGHPTGLTTSISNNDTTSSKFTASVTTSMTTQSGVLTIPVYVDPASSSGKLFNKKFTYGVAFTGATWYSGTGITGTSTTATKFSGSGVTYANVGDHYINTSTQNVYRCTVAGNASTAKWVYEQNIQGPRGISGIDGESAYFHVKYSNDGSTFTGNSGEDPGDYIGTYSDNNETDSTTFSDYTWVKIKGVTVTSIKYATSSTETQPNDSAFTYTSVPSVSAGNWLWTKITYSDNTAVYAKSYQGLNGNPGSPGQSSYTYVRYSANSDGSNMNSSPDPTRKYIGVYTGTSSTAPTTASSYTWSKYLGEDGVSVTNITSTNNTEDGGTSTVTVTLSDGTTKTFTVKNGETGSTAEWYYGTDLTHVSGTATLPVSSTSGVVVGAMYLNPNTSLVYKCTNISGSNATWTYAGDITTGVLENLDVGGTNLWVSNAGTFGYLAANGTLTLSSSVHHIASTMRRYVPVSPGEKFVYQHWNPSLIDDASNYGQVAFYNSEKTHIRYSDGATANGNYELPKVRSADGDYVVRYFVAPSNAAYMRICTCYANDLYDFRVKIERGNVPTAYSPAPEDLEAKSAGTSSPNLCFHTKNPTLEDITRTSGTPEVVTITDDGILVLQPNNSACYAKWKSYLNGGVTYQECNEKVYSVSFNAKYGTSETYTSKKQLLVYMGINLASRLETNNLSSTYDRYRAQYVTLTDNWERYHCSFSIPSTFATGATAALADGNILVIQFGAESAQVPLLIKDIKLEYGDIATEYAPSEQDTDNAINAVASSAQTANDNATAAINASKENSEAITGLDEIINGTENTTGLVDLVNNLESTKATAQSVDDLRAEKNADINKIIEDYNLSDFKNWFHFDSNQGLIIGKSGTSSGNTANYVLRLEGDIISFYENTSGIDNLNDAQRVGYFQNRNLMSENIVALSTLDLGNFRFIKQSDGNLSFVYTG